MGQTVGQGRARVKLDENLYGRNCGRLRRLTGIGTCVIVAVLLTDGLPVSVLLHDPATRDAIRARVKKISPASTRQWGKMSVDQMLWHVNQSLAQSLGKVPASAFKAPLPPFLLKFVALNMPWPKGTPTSPDFLADGKRPNLEAERARCLDLMDAFAAKNMSDPWAKSPAFGKMSGNDWSRLHAKHIDHHLKQFGV